MTTFLTTAELAQLCRTTPETVRYWRYIGKGPVSFRVGRKVLYDQADVERWLSAAKAAGATSQGGTDAA